MEARFKISARGIRWPPSSSSSSCFITNLPSPILMEILCRLPIKTLTASKCVCKSWLNLSRDPHFPQLHQARAPTEVCFQLLHDRDTIKLHMGNFHCLNNFDPLDVKLNTLFEFPKYRARSGDFYFSNSCNGLLCYNDGLRNRVVMVWNPCTSEFITIPILAATTYYCCYGFGFSGKANKYKLLQLVLSPEPKENVVAEILTIEKGCSWNTLGTCPSRVWDVIHFCNLYHDPVFLHGTLHWPDIPNMDDILTFDFEDEQFGRVPRPPSVGKKRTSEIWGVGKLLGCLSITEYTDKGINIWLMKEYGVEDSWTKMYSLPCIVQSKNIKEKCFLPVTCMDNGEILLAHNKFTSISVFSYNPDLEGFRRLGYGCGLLRVIAYRPSLVLLKDSMLGYKVHNASALKHREMSKTPDWWTPSLEKGWKGLVRATSTSSAPETLDDSDKYAKAEQREEKQQQSKQLKEETNDGREEVWGETAK